MLIHYPMIAFLATHNLLLAKDFYHCVLDLRLIDEEPGVLVFDAGGIQIRITSLPSFQPAPYTVIGWQVPNIRSEVARLAGRGLNFVRFPGFDQDSLGIWSAPDGTRVAWFCDPDGNILSLTQF